MVFSRVYNNTVLSDSLHLLVDGVLVFWALPTQFMLLSLALFVQSVTVLVWKHSSILVWRAASSSLLWSCLTRHLSLHLGCSAGSVFLVTSDVGWIRSRIYHLHLGSCLVFAQSQLRGGVAWVVLDITS